MTVLLNAGPALVPGPPTIVAASFGNRSATLSWTPPTFDGGLPVTGYVVTPYVSGSPQPPVTFSSLATTQTVTGLTNGTTYRFTVAAVNAVGIGTESGVSDPVTPEPTPPGPPTILRHATAGIGSATVSWIAPQTDGGSPLTGYNVVPYVGYDPKPSSAFNSTATTQTLTGLTSGVTYRFKVAAINAIGTGAESEVSNPVTPPTAPAAPLFVGVQGLNERVHVNWPVVESNGGSPITGYVVTAYVDGVPLKSVSRDPTDVNLVITGLTNGVAYTFTVAALNAVGTGPESPPSIPVTPAPTKPDAPTILRNATAANQSATISWLAPDNDGGSPIKGYVVTAYVGFNPVKMRIFNSTLTTQTITGLTNGTTYRFRVRAYNALGVSGFSTVTNAVTPTP